MSDSPRRQTWGLTERYWELYFGVVAAAVTVFIVAAPVNGSDTTRSAALGFLAGMVAWYVLVGRAVIRLERETWWALPFQGVLLVLFAGALTVDSSSSFLLFALCPLAYRSVRMTRAHVLVVLYAFGPAMLLLVRHEPGNLAVLLTLGVVVSTVSIVSAVTTARSERLSAERAALIGELETTRAEVARLSREAGISQERQRIAGEIHDTVAQGLSSVVMLIEAADAALDRDRAAIRDHLRLAARTARESLDETRAIVSALTPTQLGAGLADALRRLTERFSEETGIVATMSTVGDLRPLATGTEVVLLRVVQEALHNVRKHAGAAEVAVELALDGQAVTVRVRDDGVGFDPDTRAYGYGLGGMRSRVAQIGGSLSVTTGPRQGTTILTEVPA